MKAKQLGQGCLPCKGRPLSEVGQPYELLNLCSTHLYGRVRQVMMAGLGPAAPVGILHPGVEYNHLPKGG